MNVRRIDGQIVVQRSRATKTEPDSQPAAASDTKTAEAPPTKSSIEARENARVRHEHDSGAVDRERALQERWSATAAAEPAPRLDASNPAVLAGQLAYLDWQDPAKVAEDLKAKPNLTAYSAPEIEALAIVAMEHPEARPAIRGAVTQTVQAAEKLSDLPQTPGFQLLLSTQLVDVDFNDKTAPMFSAGGKLTRMVEEEVTRSFDRNLEGAKGDKQVDQAGQRFGADLQALADGYPALIGEIDGAAKKVVAANQEQMQDRRRADDNVFRRINHSITGGIRDGTSALADFVLPEAARGTQLAGPSWLKSPTVQAVGDVGAGFNAQARGAIEGPAALITDPIGGAKAIIEIAKNPSRLFDGYKQIYDEHGLNGVAGAIGFDMITSVISAQPAMDAFAPVARTAAHVARGAVDVLGDVIPEEKFLRALRKTDAFASLEPERQATLLRWVDGKEPFISPQMRDTVEQALKKTDGWNDLPPAEREAMLLKVGMSMPQFVSDARSVSGPARYLPNAEGVLSDASSSSTRLWTSSAEAVQQTLRVDGRNIRIVSPAGEATQYTADEVAKAIRSMPPEARNQLETVMIEPSPLNGAVGAAAPDGIPTIALFTTAGEKLTHDQLVSALVHESGHVISHDRWGGTLKGPEWDQWNEAKRSDGIRASTYAAVDTSEDFAETFSIYFAVKGTKWEAPVRAKLSHRFAILDELVAGEGLSSLSLGPR